MTPLDILMRYPGLVVSLAVLCIGIIGAVIARIVMRAFEWPRVVQENLEKWGGEEMADLKRENRDLRARLGIRKQMISELKIGVRGAAACLASIGDLEDEE